MNNIFVVLQGISGQSSIDFPIQMPPTPLSIIAVLQGFNTLAGNPEDGIMMYKSAPGFETWYIDFPQGLNFLTLDVRLLYYDGAGLPLAPGTLLPVTGFTWFAEQNAFSKQSNWHAKFLVEYSDMIE